jgi:C1A family cysteine protease
MFAKILLFAAVASASNETAFKSYMVKYSKTYTGAEQYSKRLAAFIENSLIIAEHNAKESSFKLGHNDVSDLTLSEFSKFYLDMNFAGARAPGSTGNVVLNGTDTATADAIDWATKGAVTPLKNQGQCGSCWSFSTTGALEGAYQIKNGKLTSFSEQELVSCDTVDGGCDGGLMDNAFSWITKNGGLCTEASYPYTSGKGVRGSCKKTCSVVSGSAPASHTDVAQSDIAMVAALNKGPVSIAIEADKPLFQLYKSGVLAATACGTKLDHGVLAVGYGTLDSTDYYKVKNSWGATWGMEGYILLEKGGTAPAKGMCGMLSGPPSYPVL